jgi:hypothetical protein
MPPTAARLRWEILGVARNNDLRDEDVRDRDSVDESLHPMRPV